MNVRLWLVTFGGLLVWAIHFGGSYGVASVFDVIDRADAPLSRLFTGGLTLACLAANVALFVLVLRLRRREAGGDFVRDWMLSIGALNAAGSFVAVLWQGLPAVVGH